MFQKSPAGNCPHRMIEAPRAGFVLMERPRTGRPKRRPTLPSICCRLRRYRTSPHEESERNERQADPHFDRGEVRRLQSVRAIGAQEHMRLPHDTISATLIVRNASGSTKRRANDMCTFVAFGWRKLKQGARCGDEHGGGRVF